MASSLSNTCWRDARDFRENAADLRPLLMEAVARWVPSPVRLTPQGLVEPADQSVPEQLAIAFDTLASPEWDVTSRVPDPFVDAGVQLIQWAKVLLVMEILGDAVALSEAARTAFRTLEAKGTQALAWSVAERKDEDVREALRAQHPIRAMKLAMGEVDHFRDAFPEAPFLADAPVKAAVHVPPTPLPTVLGIPLKKALSLDMWGDLVMRQGHLLGRLKGRWLNVSQTPWGEQIQQSLTVRALVNEAASPVAREGMISLHEGEELHWFRYCCLADADGPMLTLRQVPKAPPPTEFLGRVALAPLDITRA